MHVDSRAWQRHMPPVQSIEPQHSRELVHVPIAGLQQKLPPGSAPHDSPAQHADTPGIHVVPAATHMPPSAAVTSLRPVSGIAPSGSRTSIPAPVSEPVPPPSVPVPPSMPAARRHTPLVHESPAQHSPELATHEWPST